ncbi:Low-density lipoprotein receptor-related protein 4 [Holothuria leucospilota]|uniref:Low-density lipoprotein receptor-related protein 4 n=1 Tax=Holothuria leucospilota TaxID=206669 RepID=A0A9Q1CEG6_HOLLE|nr:Low-density lipoprotein receptor-related protein 4 [Holothuria leucospilota]
MFLCCTVKHREEFVAVVAVENPTIILFNRFSSPSFFPQIALTGATSPSALSFDRLTKFFYFSDIQSKFIGRIGLDTPATVEKLITDNVQKPLGVAVAYLTGLLYWTDADRHEVSVSRLNGTFRKAIMGSTSNCRTPRGIVLSQDQQYVFWTCETRIVKSRADGWERNFDFVSRGIFNATALSIDYFGRYLYWIDAHRGLIERVRVDGLDRKSGTNSDDGILEKVHSFVMSEHAFYFTHPGKQQVYYYGIRQQAQRTVHPVVQQTVRGLSYYKSDTDIPVTPRILNCPDDVVRTNASSSESIYWFEPTAVSRSSDQNTNVPFLSRSHVPMSFFTRGTTNVLYVFEDDLGNTAECSFKVILQPRCKIFSFPTSKESHN